MFDMIDIEDLFATPINWNKKDYKFNRDEKDMHPYTVINDDNFITIVHNVLGIDKADLKISLTREDGDYFIKIEGKTIDEYTNKEYSVSSTFGVNPEELELKQISSSMKNGLLYIQIKRKTPIQDLFEDITIDIQ